MYVHIFYTPGEGLSPSLPPRFLKIDPNQNVYARTCVRMCACVRACVRMCVRACVCVCVRACVRACVLVRVWILSYQVG